MTLSTQSNVKLLEQLKSGFKRVINWNKYLLKPELLPENKTLNHLVEPGLQGINKFFALTFENYTKRTSHSGYYFKM